MGRITSKFFRLIVTFLVIIGIAYIGIAIFANCQPDPGEYKLPKVSKAQYEIIIENTQNVFYSNEYKAVGSAIKLDSYWELTDNKYQFKDRQITLDKSIFGEITVRRR